MAGKAMLGPKVAEVIPSRCRVSEKLGGQFHPCCSNHHESSP